MAAQSGTKLVSVGSIEALQKGAAQESPRLVLVDLTMRGLNVAEVVATTRSGPCVRSIESMVRKAEVALARASTSQSGPILIPGVICTAVPSWL